MNEIKIECPNCGTEVNLDKIIKESTIGLHKELEKKDAAIAKAKDEAKLEAEKEKDAAIAKAKDEAKLEAEKEFSEEKDKIIKESQLKERRSQKKLDELTRLNQSKSQEVQGEVQEELIEDFIRRKFPKDDLVLIKKGKSGADSLLNILSPEGEIIGKILIESKNTGHFSNSWVPKILDDMTAPEADIGIIISKTLPSDFPKDQDWSYYESGLIGLVGFKYPHVYHLLEMLRFKIINSKKSSVVNNTSNELKKLWKWITSPKFSSQYRKMYNQAEKMKKDLIKLENTVNKQTSELYKNTEMVQDILKQQLFDLIKSVGEDRLPKELIKFDEEIK